MDQKHKEMFATSQNIKCFTGKHHRCQQQAYCVCGAANLTKQKNLWTDFKNCTSVWENIIKSKYEKVILINKNAFDIEHTKDYFGMFNWFPNELYDVIKFCIWDYTMANFDVCISRTLRASTDGKLADICFRWNSVWLCKRSLELYSPKVGLKSFRTKMVVCREKEKDSKGRYFVKFTFI